MGIQELADEGCMCGHMKEGGQQGSETKGSKMVTIEGANQWGDYNRALFFDRLQGGKEIGTMILEFKYRDGKTMAKQPEIDDKQQWPAKASSGKMP